LSGQFFSVISEDAGGDVSLMPSLKLRMPWGQSFAEFRKFLRPEHKKGNKKNEQQMRGLKEAFDHKFDSSI
jgi:hypothetical protein